MDEEKCYVFKPSASDRPSKRRRVERPDASRAIREEIYEEVWNRQHQRIQAVLDDANQAFFNEITKFLDDDANPGAQTVRILKAGFVLAGPDTTAHGALFEELGNRIGDTRKCVVVRAADAPNLKTLLKATIRKVVGDDNSAGGARLLDYDLQAIHDWIKHEGIDSLVLSIADSEAFPTHVLAEFIDLLGVWADRIPLVLLFGIATSVEIFQDRLPRTTLRAIRATQFDVIQSEVLLERMFEATVVDEADEKVLRIGPSLMTALLQRQRQHIQSPADFVNALKVRGLCFLKISC